MQQDKTRGVLYYNSGSSCLIRMIVSLYSLRKVYDGNISILYPKRDIEEKPFSIKTCHKIGKIFNCDIQEIDMGVPKGKNRVFLERTKYHTITPYEISLSIDSDTVIIDKRITDYFDAAEENEFALAQFSDWKPNNGVIRKRIAYWEKHYPEDVQAAWDFGHGINCGLFAFRKDSQIMQQWYDKAIIGRETFIADESCMQLLIPHNPVKIMGSEYNTSCKYDKNIHKADYPVVIHFHGKKHCRMSDEGYPTNNAEYWLYYFNQCIENNIFKQLNIDIVYSDYDDKTFRKNQTLIHRYLKEMNE